MSSTHDDVDAGPLDASTRRDAAVSSDAGADARDVPDVGAPGPAWPSRRTEVEVVAPLARVFAPMVHAATRLTITSIDYDGLSRGDTSVNLSTRFGITGVYGIEGAVVAPNGHLFVALAVPRPVPSEDAADRVRVVEWVPGTSSFSLRDVPTLGTDLNGAQLTLVGVDHDGTAVFQAIEASGRAWLWASPDPSSPWRSYSVDEGFIEATLAPDGWVLVRSTGVPLKVLEPRTLTESFSCDAGWLPPDRLLSGLDAHGGIWVPGEGTRTGRYRRHSLCGGAITGSVTIEADRWCPVAGLDVDEVIMFRCDHYILHSANDTPVGRIRLPRPTIHVLSDPAIRR